MDAYRGVSRFPPGGGGVQPLHNVCIFLTHVTGPDHEEVSTNIDPGFLCVFLCCCFLVFYILFYFPGGSEPFKGSRTVMGMLLPVILLFIFIY